MFRRLGTTQIAFDAIVAVVFGFLALAGQLQASQWLDIIALLVMVPALALRRLSPALALALAWLACILQMAAMGAVPSFLDAAVLPILYATARYGGNALRWVGLASAVLGAAIATAYLTLVPYLDTAAVPARAFALSPGLTGSVLLSFFGLLAVFGLSWTLGLLALVWRRGRDSRLAQRLAERDVALEQERNRIARDMHDVVAHSLAVVIAQADGARYARAADPEAVDVALTTIAGTAREALADVRILLGQLRYSQGEAPQPALADLDRLVEQFTDSGLEVGRTEHGTALPIAAGQQLALYRIAQEALTNALRHGAGRVELRFDWLPESVVLSVTNEIGAGSGSADGHGLAGMRERALLAGGRLEAGRVGDDWVVTARLPIGGPA
jgi:signal transduction histidine kinase